MENNFQIDSAAISDRGLSKKRPQNEDSFLEFRQHGIFAVADGVGGAQAGDVASQMAMEILGEAFANLHNGYDNEEVMRMAIERANQSIFQMSNDLAQLSSMATTIVALHLDGNIATIGHVGDSRLYRLDAKGDLLRETEDHSLVEEELRAGLLTPEQAANHPNKNIISRALGAEASVEVDMKTIMFEPNTVFLLCSDGVTRHIEDFELGDILRQNVSPAEICRQLKSICYERGAEDNLTAVIVKVLEAGARVYSDAPADFEASTVTTARAAAPAAFAADFDEMPTQEIKRQNVEIESAVASAERRNEVYRKENNSSAFGKIFASMVLMLLGASIGAGAYYIWVQKQMSAAAPLEDVRPPSETAQTVFENKRRTVDRNPVQFLQNKSGSVETAEDFYLLGRANLLNGNYQEAKTAFTEAKNRLAMADAANSPVLANEIAMGLAIISASEAQKELQRELNFYRNVPTAAENSNLNVNISTNSP